jgi:hypothetical protein
MLRRLRAEASVDAAFDPTAVAQRVQDCAQQGWAVGPAGFGAAAEMCVVLAPVAPDERPMALAFIYEPSEQIDPAALAGLLQRSIEGCMNPSSDHVVDLEERRARG